MDPYAAVVMSFAVNCWGSVVVMPGMAFGFHVKLTGAADALPAPAIVRRAVAAPTSNTGVRRILQAEHLIPPIGRRAVTLNLVGPQIRLPANCQHSLTAEFQSNIRANKDF